MSKLLERLVCQQLVTYLKINILLPDLQSAFRAHHSTETAVLKVMSDILLALDSGNLALLTLLDLSAAFDSVHHATLIQHPQKSYGLCDVALKWITQWTNTVCPNVCDHFQTICIVVWSTTGLGPRTYPFCTLHCMQMYCSL